MAQQQPALSSSGGYGGAWDPPSHRQQVGDPQGLNPFSSTMNPESRLRHTPMAFDQTSPSGPPPRAPALNLTPIVPAQAAPLTTLTSQRAGMDPDHVPEHCPRSLAGFLVHFRDEIGEFWPLFQGLNWVGRSGTAGVDVPLDDAATSSRHALILAAARPGRLKVEDLGSTNGTYVGRHRLQPGQRHELTDGDLLRFGTLMCIVKIV